MAEDKKARQSSRARRSQDASPKQRATVKPKSATKASPARIAALEVVAAVRERAAFAQDVITTRIDNSSLSEADRAFATRLVLGVVSSSGTLDDIIDRALNKPSDIKDNVRDALRVSTYEIIFLEKSPHAAVDQGVELVRSTAPKAAGLANSVLRKIVALKESFLFGDPRQDIEALARLHAFPVWLATKLVKDLGLSAAHDFMKASNEPAPLFVAINDAKATQDEVLTTFEKAGACVELVDIDESPVKGCLRVLDGRSLLLPEVRLLFVKGKILVSDAASQLVAASILPQTKPSSLLEIGAGRATKTILIQSAAHRLWGSQVSEYVTVDNHEFKAKLLMDRAQQYGAHVSEVLTGDALCLGEYLGDRHFDVVFIDAPCSGLGTLRRHPEIRWRLESENLQDFADVQLGMLKSAAAHVCAGGTLAYATCTVTSDEDNGVVKAFLSSDEGSDFRLAPIAGKSCLATQLTSGSSDAHFAVSFVKGGQTQ